MKSFYVLTVAVALLAGCSPNNQSSGPAAPPIAPSVSTTTLKADPKAAGEAFLKDNGKKDGVITTASGLQYKILKSGTGASPKSSDTVRVNYEGSLLDGTIFDSSYQRGESITFPVTGVIPGWVEALQLMKVGDKWQLFIPSNLAYGAQGAGPQIPPNSTLVFQVELIDIVH
ncbi:MAG TPA: FKBP-type peptidyl-prolyl cis-trans isomerase [Verrucomicrobiae bacterium]